jgi:YVTN family beta-propeller protein
MAFLRAMQNVTERARRPSPAGRPQPLAFHGKTLWMGSWDTDKLYAIDPATWTVTDEVAAPGKPYGLAVVGSDMRVVVSIGEDDDRYLYRFVPGQGFDESSKTACPDFTGSALASDGTTLYLAQMGLRRIVTLNDAGAVATEVSFPARIAGMGFGPGGFYVISADEEFENLKVASFDLNGKKEPEPLAGIPFDGARTLAYDGTAWWTSDREVGEIVSFTL